MPVNWTAHMQPVSSWFLFRLRRRCDMGQDDPVGLIARVPSLSRDDQARILGGNAASLGLVGPVLMDYG